MGINLTDGQPHPDDEDQVGDVPPWPELPRTELAEDLAGALQTTRSSPDHAPPSTRAPVTETASKLLNPRTTQTKISRDNATTSRASPTVLAAEETAAKAPSQASAESARSPAPPQAARGEPNNEQASWQQSRARPAETASADAAHQKVASGRSSTREAAREERQLRRQLAKLRLQRKFNAVEEGGVAPPSLLPSDVPDPDTLAAPFGASRFPRDLERELTVGATAEIVPAPPPEDDQEADERSAPSARFIEQAERAARWQHPITKGLLWAGSAVAFAALVIQSLFYQRDVIAAQWPASGTAMVQFCRLAGCKLASPLAIDQVVLDSSTLVATPDAHVLRLTADLHNRAKNSVRAPAFELTLTDDNGAMLARRVLMGAELGAPSDSLGAETSWHLESRLDVGALHVAGYTLEIFYP